MNQITLNNLQNFFQCLKVDNYKVGLSTRVNKFYLLNGQIELSLLNISHPAYENHFQTLRKLRDH